MALSNPSGLPGFLVRRIASVKAFSPLQASRCVLLMGAVMPASCNAFADSRTTGLCEAAPGTT